MGATGVSPVRSARQVWRSVDRELGSAGLRLEFQTLTRVDTLLFRPEEHWRHASGTQKICRESLPFGVIQPVLFQLLVERIAVDPQPCGRFDLHAVAQGHHLRNHLAFHAIDDPAMEVAILFGGRREALDHQFLGQFLKVHRTRAERLRLPPGAHRLGQQFKSELIAERHDDDPLDVILQFPDISGPAERDEQLRSLLDAQTGTVVMFGKSWDFHVERVLGATLDENLAMIHDSVAFMRSEGREVIFDAEHFFDGFAANPAYALDCLRSAVEGGAGCLVLCDTISQIQ